MSTQTPPTSTKPGGGPSAPIGVLVVDDNTLIGDSMTRWFTNESDLKLLGWTGTVEEAATMVKQLRPDIVLLDVDIPGGDTFKLLRQIVKEFPGTKVIMLSGLYHEQYIEKALDEGAMGYIVKDETPASIIKLVRKAAAGSVVLSATARMGPQ